MRQNETVVTRVGVPSRNSRFRKTITIYGGAVLLPVRLYLSRGRMRNGKFLRVWAAPHPWLRVKISNKKWETHSPGVFRALWTSPPAREHHHGELGGQE